MRLSRFILGLPLVALLAGCGDDARDQDLVFTDTETTTPATETPPTAAPAPGAPAGEMAQSAELRELQGSGVGGDVTVRDRGTQTEVMVRLTGTPANSTHPGHIHSGTCDAIGGVVQALEPINTDATGTGTMTATVDVQPMTMMDGQHVVVYHGAGGTPVACAQVPAHRM
jgi:hypothetical protein